MRAVRETIEPRLRHRLGRATLAGVGLLLAASVLYLSLRSSLQPDTIQDLRWETGRYSLSYRVQNSIDLNAITALSAGQSYSSHPLATKMGFSGTLNILTKDYSSLHLWLEKASADAIEVGANSSQDIRAVLPELAEPISLVQDQEGRFLTLSFPKSCRTICQQMWGALLAPLQIVAPPSAAMQTWETEEKSLDATLAYRYERSPSQVLKTRLSLASFYPLRAIASKLQSQAEGLTRITRGDRGALHELESHLSFALQNQGHSIYSRAEQMELHWLDQRIQEPQTAEVSAPLPWQAGALDKQAEAIAIAEAWRRELGTSGFSELSQQLTADLNHEEELALYKKIRAFFWVHPKESSLFLETLVQAPYNSRTHRLVAVALGRVGHPQAQAVLREAIRRRLAESKEVLNFLPLLAQTDQPDAESLSYLEELAHGQGSEQRTAYLSYGQILGTYAKIQPQAAQEKLLRMTQELKQSSPKQRPLILDAMGNSGQIDFFPAIREVLQGDQDPSVLIAGLLALRRMDSLEVRNYLIEKTRSQEDGVAAAAWNSLSDQTYDPRLEPKARALLLGHGELSSQLAALEWVWQHRKAQPDRAELFERLRSDATRADVLKQKAQAYAEALGSQD